MAHSGQLEAYLIVREDVYRRCQDRPCVQIRGSFGFCFRRHGGSRKDELERQALESPDRFPAGRSTTYARAACGSSGWSAVGVWNICAAGEHPPSSGIADTSEPLCSKQVRLADDIRTLASCWRCSACLFALTFRSLTGRYLFKPRALPAVSAGIERRRRLTAEATGRCHLLSIPQVRFALGQRGGMICA
jgi:hypothetical protein